MIQIKRIVLSCFVLLVIASISYAQTGELSKFELGIEGGMAYSYRSLKKVEETQSSGYIYDNLNNEHKASYLPQGSFLFSWNPSSRWRVSTGISYSIRGYESHRINANFADPNDPKLPEAISYTNRLKCLEIPLLGDFFLWKRPKRFNAFVRGGIIYSPSIQEENTSYFYYKDHTDVVIDPFDLAKNSMLLLAFSSGIQYKLGNRFHAEFLLKYQRGLTPINHEYVIYSSNRAELDTYLWNIGAVVSCRYTL